MTTINISDYKRAAQAGIAQRGSSAGPLTLARLVAHAKEATLYDVRIKGTAIRGRRFALKSVEKSGTFTLIAFDGEEVSGVTVADVVIDPCSKSEPLATNPFDSGK